MRIDRYTMEELMDLYKIELNGVLHVGAHYCEELEVYHHHMGIPYNDMLWIEPVKEFCDHGRNRGVPNIYQALISNEDGKEVNFNISNNGESSSMLEFGTHKECHPQVEYVRQEKMITEKLDTFLAKNNLDPKKYHFWNIDVQGAELMVLQGGTDALQHAKMISIEVNEQELYKGCALLPEIDTFLDKAGFARVLTDIVPGCHWGDAIYIKRQTILDCISANTSSSLTLRIGLKNYVKKVESFSVKDVFEIISLSHQFKNDIYDHMS